MAFGDLAGVMDGAVRALLGGPVTIWPESGSPVTVQGIFEPNFRRGLDTALPGVVIVGPAVFVPAAGLPDNLVGRQVDIGGTSYRVREAQRDGQGGATLHLLAA